MEEPMLSRLNRLDNILKQLEEIRSVSHSPKSSSASTPSSTSDGQPSSSDFSPLEKHCRPVEEVMTEVETKGTLIQRLIHAEDRILKLSLQMEEEFELERSRELRGSTVDDEQHHKMSHSPKKALKKFVKSCVGTKKKHKNHG